LARPEVPVAPGRLELLARTEEEGRQAAEIALAAWSQAPRHGRFVEVGAGRAYFKMSPLAGKSRVRYALKRGLLRRPLPRLAEFANLVWLREHGFGAPEPIAAGALWSRGLPRFQFLFTREVEGARTLAAFLAEERDPGARAEVLQALAKTVARMHALRFLHHDLFPRNVLVTGPSDVAFLDCWAGGLPPQMRAPAYDLACLTSELSAADLDLLVENYVTARSTQDRNFDRDRFLRSVERVRRALVTAPR